jgi:hypothetical protein
VTDWQLIYYCILIAAVIVGWGQHRIIVVMAVNFLVSAFGPQTGLVVETFEIACAAVLLFGSDRAKVIGFLFAIIAAIGIATEHFAWSTSATYAIMDLMAIVQCGVLARVDRGGPRLVRSGIRAIASRGRPYRSSGRLGAAIRARIVAKKDR